MCGGQRKVTIENPSGKKTIREATPKIV